MDYKESMLAAKAEIEGSAALRESIRMCMGIQNAESPARIASYPGKVYRTGKIQTPDSYVAIKAYSAGIEPRIARIKILDELALFDYFAHRGMPVPAFSLMATSGGRHCIVTQDMTHNGEYELEEFCHCRKNMFHNYSEIAEKALFGWKTALPGFTQLPLDGLFVTIDKERAGKPVFADLDGLALYEYVSDMSLIERIMAQFDEAYPERGYEIVLDN